MRAAPLARIKGIGPAQFYSNELESMPTPKRSSGWTDAGLCPFHADGRNTRSVARTTPKLKVLDGPSEAEVSHARALLGCVLLDWESTRDDFLSVPIEVFPSGQLREIAEAVLAVHGRGGVPDQVTVATDLMESGHLDDAGGVSYLAELVNHQATSVNASHFAAELKRLADPRLLSAYLEAASRYLLDPQADAASIRQAVIDVLTEPGAAQTTKPWQRSDIRAMLHNSPPPVDYVFDGIIERGQVYSLQGKPGIGKSSFMLQLGVSCATGIQAFPSFRPTRPGKVLLQLAEDVEHHVWRRLRANDLAFQAPELLEQNLILYCRQSGDLCRLVKGEVVRTPVWGSINREIDLEGVDLAIMDPLNRVYGLDENDNTQAKAFVEAIEALAGDHCAVILSHHVSKAQADSLAAEAGRGASALIGGWRGVLSMAEVPKSDLRYYCIPEADARRYVLLDLSKSNYSERPSRPLAFARGAHGVLSEVSLGDRRGAVVSDFLAQQFSAKGLVVNLRKLKRGMRSDQGVDLLVTDLKNEFGRSLTNKHIAAAIDECLASGALVLKTEERGEQVICAPGMNLAQHG